MSTVRARLQSGPAIAGLAVVLTALLFSTIAWASGWPPFAARDAAVVARGGTVEELSTGAKSVLDNDFDLENDQLTAVLTKGVRHGSLVLRSDGTFTYQHDGGKSKDDEFKYRASDGTGVSREAAVEISVEKIPNTPPFVVSDVPDQTATEGSEFRLVLVGNFADPDEGDVLSFRIEGLPTSGSLQFDEDLAVLEGTPVAADVRDMPYKIRVTATDRQGASASLEFELLILQRNEPPVVVAQVPDQKAIEGIAYSLNLAASFDDPDEGDVLSFRIEGLPTSGSLQFDEDLAVLEGTPVAADVRDTPYKIKVTATDRQGASASLEFELLILRRNEPPVVVAQVPDQEAIEGIAYSLDLAASFDDPDEGDQLRFRSSGLPASGSLQLDAATGLLSGTPTREDALNEAYTIQVQVTDIAGATATLSFQLLILRDNRSDLVLGIALAANPVTVGENVQWNIDIENKGPADLQDGQLFAGWVTSGPPLTVTAPQGCLVTDNGTSSPTMDCTVALVETGTTLAITVQGVQEGDGDNSLIGVVSADDPNPGDNEDLASAAVVAEFSEGPTQIIDVSGAALRAADLNGDGAVDIVATGTETIVFFNNGDRAVTTPGTSFGPDSGGSAVAILEWNGDASPDIAVGGLNGRSVEVFVNDGSGGFTTAASVQGGGIANVSDLLEADLDGDGVSELLVTGSGGTALLRPAAQGGIDVTPLASGAGRDLAVADFDQDGDQDFVVVLAADRRVELNFNGGDGSIARVSSLDLGSVANVSGGDINGDGAVDLLLAIDGNDMSAPVNKILYQQGSGEFSPGPSFGASPVTALVTGDIDADGWTDIVAINEAGVHQLYLGSQGGDFALAPEQIVSDGMQRGVLTDFNSDESLDLILAGPDAGVLEIHANNGIGRLGLGDRIGPEIELLGAASVNIPAGQEYVDPGATAADDIDGDITDKIEVSGTVNSTVVGTQTITYSVADRAGNRASATRTVIVGVNEGTGGGGGGLLTPLFVMTLLILSLGRRSRRLNRLAIQ